MEGSNYGTGRDTENGAIGSDQTGSYYSNSPQGRPRPAAAAQARPQPEAEVFPNQPETSYAAESQATYRLGLRRELEARIRTGDAKWLNEALTKRPPAEWVVQGFRRAFKVDLKRNTAGELRKLLGLYNNIIATPYAKYLPQQMGDLPAKARLKLENLEKWHAKLLEDWQLNKASRTRDYMSVQDLQAEKVIDVYRRHKVHITMLALLPIGLGIVNLILFLIFRAFVPFLLPLNVFLLFVDIAWFFWSVNDWSNDYLMITNRRVMQYEKLTLFNEDKKVILIERVEQVSYQASRNLIEFIFRIGTVTITGAGKIQIVFNRVYLPDRMRKEIMDAKVSYIKTRNEFRSLRMENNLRNKFLGEKNVTIEGEPPQVAAVPRSELGFWETFVPSKPIDEGNDHITFRSHPIFLYRDWIKILGLYIILLLVGIFALPLLFSLGNGLVSTIGFVVFLLAIVWNTIMLWYYWEDWYNDRFVLSNKDILDVVKKPLGLDEEQNVITLAKVQDIELVQPGLIANFLDYGDVRVTTAGAGTPIIFRRVPNPDSVRSEISRRMEIAKNLAEDFGDKLTLDYFGHFSKVFQDIQANLQNSIREGVSQGVTAEFQRRMETEQTPQANNPLGPGQPNNSERNARPERPSGQ